MYPAGVGGKTENHLVSCLIILWTLPGFRLNKQCHSVSHVVAPLEMQQIKASYKVGLVLSPQAY